MGDFISLEYKKACGILILIASSYVTYFQEKSATMAQNDGPGVKVHDYHPKES
jgi:hypothetical protein